MCPGASYSVWQEFSQCSAAVAWVKWEAAIPLLWWAASRDICAVMAIGSSLWASYVALTWLWNVFAMA